MSALIRLTSLPMRKASAPSCPIPRTTQSPVIDLDTGTAIGAASTGDYPHGLRMSPDGKSIYVANVKDGTVSVIDTATLAET
ncbi:MAG: hypothetical protein E5V24_16950, partial [Mesorhizobium sp.]